jgi:hypothetical protein
MKIDLTGWKLDSKINEDQRLVTVTIHLKYPDITPFLELKRKKRIKAIDQDYQSKLSIIVSSGVFSDYEITGTSKRPIGIKATLALNLLEELEVDHLISGITVHNVANAKKLAVKSKGIEKFFCVKMTVIIEIENLKSKKQDIEERLVLIKATSANDAYEKLDDKNGGYATPYLNPHGRLVRWRIYSLDDCYETDIITPKDIELPEGVEVYSKLKSKKRKTVWDGR